jgi:hypothetical protein
MKDQFILMNARFYKYVIMGAIRLIRPFEFLFRLVQLHLIHAWHGDAVTGIQTKARSCQVLIVLLPELESSAADANRSAADNSSEAVSRLDPACWAPSYQKQPLHRVASA